MFRMMMVSLVMLATTPVVAQSQNATKGPLLTNPIGFGDFLQMLLGLVLVLGVIFAMAWVIRRMGQMPLRMHGVLRVICGISVGQRERIMLIQVGEQQLLIGIAPGQIRTLHVLSEPIRVDDNKPFSRESFAERLQAMMKGKQP